MGVVWWCGGGDDGWGRVWLRGGEEIGTEYVGMDSGGGGPLSRGVVPRLFIGEDANVYSKVQVYITSTRETQHYLAS